jgi:hypothetical protein
MNDLVMLNVELDRCKARLRDLHAELDSALGATPTDPVALRDLTKQLIEITSHLEATTRAILTGPPSQVQ